MYLFPVFSNKWCWTDFESLVLYVKHLQKCNISIFNFIAVYSQTTAYFYKIRNKCEGEHFFNLCLINYKLPYQNIFFVIVEKYQCGIRSNNSVGNLIKSLGCHKSVVEVYFNVYDARDAKKT